MLIFLGPSCRAIILHYSSLIGNRFCRVLTLVKQPSSKKAVNMKTRGATSFIKAILLVLLTSAHPSLQDSEYNPSSFPGWNELRSCAQACLSDGPYDALTDSNLGCSLNGCFCRVDIIPQAVSIVSTCASTACSDTNDVVSATSFYEAYCASATNTAAISLITNSPPTAVPGSTVTGTTSMLFSLRFLPFPLPSSL
jgi:hypothetical protein